MKKIIVIDPDKKFRTLINSICDNKKVELMFFDEGKDGVDAIVDNNPDLVVLNLELPDMNGFLVCNMLKKNSLTKSIPIIITSAEKSEKDFEQHKKLKLRAEQYYKKPFSGEDLKNGLKEFVGADIFKQEKPDVVDDFTEENIDKLLDSTFLQANEPDENIVASDDSTEFDIVDSITKSTDNQPTKEEKLEAEEDSAISLDFSADLEGSDEFEILPSEEKEMVLPNDKKEEKSDELIIPSEDNDDEVVLLESDEEQEPTTQKFDQNIEDAINRGQTDLPTEQLTMELDKLKHKTAELENLYKEKEEALNKFKENNQDLSAELLSLEKQNEFLKTENKNLLLNIKSLQADIEEKVSKSEAEVSKMKEQMEAAIAEKEDLANRFEEINSKHTELLEQVENLKEEVESLRKENNNLSEKVTALEEEVQEKEKLIARKEEEKLLETEKMFDEFKAKEEVLKNQIETLEKDKNDIQMQLLDKQKSLQELVEKLEIENQQQKEQIETLDSENNTISEKLYEIETNFEKLKEEKAEKEKILLDSNANLTKNLMEAEKELEKYKNKFENLMKVINEE